MKTIVATPAAPAAVGPYSQAVKTGNTLYLSGQIGLDPATGALVSDTVEAQTAQVLTNMRAVLEAAGATPDNIVKVTVFMIDMSEFQIVNTLYAGMFGTNPPARSCVGVQALPKGARVEIEAIAIV